MRDPVDLLIVGSGPVGASFARLVAERRPDTTIVMVDLGPLLTPTPGVNLRNLPVDERARAQLLSQGPERGRLGVDGGYSPGGATRATQGLHLARAGGMPAAVMASCVGGMGAHWSCVTPRPHGSELISFIDGSSWSHAVTTAECLLMTSHDMYSESASGRAIRAALAAVFEPLLPRDRPVGILPMAGRRLGDGRVQWTGVDTILAASGRGRSNVDRFTLHPETICRSLTTKGGLVTGAMLEHRPSGDRRHLAARAVVIAADALRTPQLLWASGVRPQALGRYLTEHPVSVGLVELDPKAFPALAESTPDAEFISVSCVPFVEPNHPFHAQIAQTRYCEPLHPRHDALGNHAGFAYLTWMGRKWPREQDRVAFSDTRTDWCGMPAMRIEYALTTREHDDAMRGLELLDRAAAVLGRYVAGWEPCLQPAGASTHYQGTVRIGERDDGASVCDSYCRVWGFRNLFVGGNGVIPTATACNPTLTSIALAVRSTTALIDVLD